MFIDRLPFLPLVRQVRLNILILVLTLFILIPVYALEVITDIYEGLVYNEINVYDYTRKRRYRNGVFYSQEQSSPYDMDDTEFEDYYDRRTPNHNNAAHPEDYYTLPYRSDEYDPRLYLFD